MDVKEMYEKNRELLRKCEEIIFAELSEEKRSIRRILMGEAEVSGYERTEQLLCIREEVKEKGNKFVELYNIIQSVNRNLLEDSAEMEQKFRGLKYIILDDSEVPKQLLYYNFPELKGYEKRNFFTGFQRGLRFEKNAEGAEILKMKKKELQEDIKWISLNDYYRRAFEQLKNILMEINCNYLV